MLSIKSLSRLKWHIEEQYNNRLHKEFNHWNHKLYILDCRNYKQLTVTESIHSLLLCTNVVLGEPGNMNNMEELYFSLDVHNK